MSEFFRLQPTEAIIGWRNGKSVSSTFTKLTDGPLNDILTAGNFIKEKLIREIYRKARVCESL